MKIKHHLKVLQKRIPYSWLYRMQDIHSRLIYWWILHLKSKPLTFSNKTVIVFSPHQDDETFGCGGMIAMKRAQGISVVVAFLTDGRGAGRSDQHFQEKIIQIRKQEALTALQILGVETSKIHFLEKPDGTLQNFNHQQKQQTIEQIVELIKYYQPEEVYVPHPKDCHKDHEATYELVKAAITQTKIAVELWQYPIWLFWRAPLFILLKLKDITAAHYFSITSVQNKKKQAIASYLSQTQNLPPGFIKQFMGTHEIFFKAKLE